MMDRLDKLISKYGMCRSIEFTEMCRLLIELKQRRQSDLRPADKFLGNKLEDQWVHIMSECYESREALCNLLQVSKSESGDFKQKFVEELIDLQMSCETMLAILGLDERQRMEARRKVIEKNEARGYYVNNNDGEVIE